MTVRHFFLSLLLAAQLAACGGASVATPEPAACRCADSSASPSSTVAQAPAAPAPVVPAAASASGPATPSRSASTRGAGGSVEVARNGETRAVGPLRVRRIVLARGIENRAPTEAGERFALRGDDRLYTWVEVENGSEEAAELVFTWVPPAGAPRGGQTLEVPTAPRWRTWAFTRQTRTPGEWTAEVRTGDGQLLARQTFTVEAPAVAANAEPRS